MRVVNWNICQGGREKENEIVRKLKDINADLIVITEFRNNNPGSYIKNALRSLGYSYQSQSSENKNKNGVGIFSKLPFELMPNNFSDPEKDITENVVTFVYQGYTFIATFCANDTVTRLFIEKILNMNISENTIIIGDLNTGPRGSGINRFKHLDALVSRGFVDIWRLKHSEPCWSYQSPTGKSHPDHVLCKFEINPEDNPDKFNVEFDLSPISDKISDHGIMVFEFDYETL